MRPLAAKLKPSKGFAHVLYVVLNVLLPMLVFVLVRAGFVQMALAVILLSKWRMFAVRPRFWLANIRTNAVDVIVGLSALALMDGTDTMWLQATYAAAWIVWLMFIKPRHNVFWMSMQALFGQVVGLMAVFSAWDYISLVGLVTVVGFICFFAAHHFFYGFDEEHIRLLAYIWAYFGAALTWILGHWLVYYYDVVAQPTLILTAMAFSMGTLYYLDHFDKLSRFVRREILFILATILLVVIVFSDWGDKTV
ncbi:hypothetical protein CSA80_03805 [Candidatus Saccharibacteria bacterium]|nr:MAG: hypothetical protein CSA80_03805 [Candidatus Saccharibacteria bacterium]